MRIKSLFFLQEFHKEGSVILKSRMSSWGPRKIKSNAHFYAAFKMIEEEVIESNDSVIQQLFVEVFKDKDSFIENMVENMNKVQEVEVEMTGGLKRTMSEIDECSLEEPENLNKKVEELLDKFEGQSLLHTTKFFKVIHKANQPILAIAHPRIQKKADNLSYMINLKGFMLKTDCAALTNLDSDKMSGRGNIGTVSCTLVPLRDLSEDVRKKVLARFNMDVDIEELEGNDEQPSASQDFPFIQSQTQDTIKLCNICRFATRDKLELKEHMTSHFQCDVCSQFYSSKEELDHHTQNHMKVSCKECNTKVRKDELHSHNLNHVQLNSFGKKIRKPSITKQVTGYGLWQKQERKRIVDCNPDMISTEVSSELGRRWKLVDTANKADWKKQALEFNKQLKQRNQERAVQEEVDDYIEGPVVSDEIEVHAVVADGLLPVVFEDPTDVIQDDDDGFDILATGDDAINVIESIPSSSNGNNVEKDDSNGNKNRRTAIEHSKICPLCDFSSQTSKEVAIHMKQKHRFIQPTIKQCKECKLIFYSETTLASHMEANHGDKQADVEMDEQVENEIVLVKMRKLAWPAIVTKRENDMVKVRMIYDDSIKTVNANDIEPFDVRKISNTKNSRLKQAFAKADELSKK